MYESIYGKNLQRCSIKLIDRILVSILSKSCFEKWNLWKEWKYYDSFEQNWDNKSMIIVSWMQKRVQDLELLAYVVAMCILLLFIRNNI